ncbi:hypothetical protein V5F49_20240 [Xanthobacter sp. V3C-3]|uniref:hypothetical protein n=1 Tax=Xanthobacter lutulentifluminis TaxID=3119935 RepID=UPI0037297E23
MATEQRAFAAVSPEGKIAIQTIRSTPDQAAVASNFWRVVAAGWRIRPIIIRLEEQDK